MNTILNQITLVGFLTSTVRVSEHNGTPVANFTVVTNTPMGKDKDDKAEYHDVSLWGNLVPAIADKLEGSPQVIVKGALRYKQVTEDKITNKNPYINCDEIYILPRAAK